MSTEEEHKEIHVPTSTTVDEEHLEPIQLTPLPAHIPILRQLGVALGLLVLVFTTTFVGAIVVLLSPGDEEEDIRITSKLGSRAIAQSGRLVKMMKKP